MEEKLDDMMATINKLATTVNQIAEGQTQIIKRLDSLEVGQEGLKQSATDMQTELSEIGKTVNSSQGDIKTLLEITATKKEVSKINSKVDVLSIHLIDQEAEILELKLAK